MKNVILFIVLLLLNTSLYAQSSDESDSYDSAIIANIQTKIANTPVLTDTNIHVTSEQGIVTLSGTVNKQSQIDTVIELAKETDDVTDVKSSLIVVKRGHTHALPSYP